MISKKYFNNKIKNQYSLYLIHIHFFKKRTLFYNVIVKNTTFLDF